MIKSVESFRTGSEVEARFNALMSQLRQDTRFESNYGRVMMHPAYRGIIGLGPQVVPLILRNLTDGAGPWIAALEDITGENPVAAEHESSSKLMVEDWLAWGKRNGII